MKRKTIIKGNLILLLIILATILAEAQQIENKSNATCAIQVRAERELYAGIENKLAIVIPGVNQNSISATSSVGKIEKKGGAFIFYSENTGNAEITVKAGGRIIEKYKFNVLKIPLPRVVIGNNPEIWSGDGMSKYLLSNLHLSCYFDNGEDFEFRVVSFRVFANQKGLCDGFWTEGNRFSPQQHGFIRSLKNGKRVSIYDIKAQGPDGKIVSLRSLSFRLK